MTRIFEITEKVASYAPKADLDRINRAYVLAANAHIGQTRRSGDPYISHPLAVAGILASMKMDESTIITGLLHDTVEDTPVSLGDIERHFGADVARLVDGVTKIGRISFRSSEHKQAENFRKMLMATAKDIRVLIVKLADRLHNMRTLGFVNEDKQRRIATETMQIYAPLAHRLGIHWLHQELEDLAFACLDREAYKELLHKLQGRLDRLNRTRERLEAIIQEALQRQGLKARVQGRMKHLYSIYEKMQRKHVDFDEIYDLVAFRIIVDDIPTCYQALGVIHSLYRPIPGRFKDYIALPKPNGYQSLHTAVIGPDNFRIEVQIRTQAMHAFAEDGVAAHWVYKEGSASAKDLDVFKWLKQLTELVQEAETPDEFLENMRLDLFVREVYVFSPRGEIFALPRGATPLDFAYAVHTEVGHHCMAVRVNGELSDFATPLRNGDQVEVITSPDQTPSHHWLQYVKTPRARQAIRQWFRRQEKETSIRLGRQILQDALGKKDVGGKVLKRLGYDRAEDFLEHLGRGDIPVQKVLDAVAVERTRPFHLKGMTHVLMAAADCCRPIPGDPVVGMFVSGKGMVIHHRRCPKVTGSKDENWLEVEWRPQPSAVFRTGIEVRARNERGMLARVSSSIADAGSGIEDLKLRQKAGDVAEMLFLVEVRDRKHLADVLRNIRRVDGVMGVRRREGLGLGEKPGGRGLADTIKRLFAARQ